MEKIEKFIIDHKKLRYNPDLFRQNKKGLKQMTWIKILWIFWKNKQKILRKVEKSEKSISCKENFAINFRLFQRVKMAILAKYQRFG